MLGSLENSEHEALKSENNSFRLAPRVVRAGLLARRHCRPHAEGRFEHYLYSPPYVARIWGI